MTFTNGPFARGWLCLLTLLLAACAQQPMESPDTEEVIAARVALPAEAVALFGRSLSAMRKQDWSGAEQSLSDLGQRFPDCAGVWLNLGIVYNNSGRPEQAEQAFRQAIAANPEKLEAYNHLGVLLRQAGRFDEAEGQYRAALAVAPQDSETHRNLGILYDLYLGDAERARVHYQAYQDGLAEPDRQVNGWIVDLDRRQARLKAELEP